MLRNNYVKDDQTSNIEKFAKIKFEGTNQEEISKTMITINKLDETLTLSDDEVKLVMEHFKRKLILYQTFNRIRRSPCALIVALSAIKASTCLQLSWLSIRICFDNTVWFCTISESTVFSLSFWLSLGFFTLSELSGLSTTASSNCSTSFGRFFDNFIGLNGEVFVGNVLFTFLSIFICITFDCNCGWTYLMSTWVATYRLGNCYIVTDKVAR